jgi:hypothetical protein
MARERANARTATPITIAVSTSAWGTGSTMEAISISILLKMGAVPLLIYPIEIRKRFTDKYESESSYIVNVVMNKIHQLSSTNLSIMPAISDPTLNPMAM